MPVVDVDINYVEQVDTASSSQQAQQVKDHKAIITFGNNPQGYVVIVIGGHTPHVREGKSSTIQPAEIELSPNEQFTIMYKQDFDALSYYYNPPPHATSLPPLDMGVILDCQQGPNHEELIATIAEILSVIETLLKTRGGTNAFDAYYQHTYRLLSNKLQGHPALRVLCTDNSKPLLQFVSEFLKVTHHANRQTIGDVFTLLLNAPPNLLLQPGVTPPSIMAAHGELRIFLNKTKTEIHYPSMIKDNRSSQSIIDDLSSFLAFSAIPIYSAETDLKCITTHLQKRTPNALFFYSVPISLINQAFTTANSTIQQQCLGTTKETLRIQFATKAMSINTPSAQSSAVGNSGVAPFEQTIEIKLKELQTLFDEAKSNPILNRNQWGIWQGISYPNNLYLALGAIRNAADRAVREALPKLGPNEKNALIDSLSNYPVLAEHRGFFKLSVPTTLSNLRRLRVGT